LKKIQKKNKRKIYLTFKNNLSSTEQKHEVFIFIYHV
jgi:hypothetical protein